jgi:histidine phosphotransferase ChpT
MVGLQMSWQNIDRVLLGSAFNRATSQAPVASPSRPGGIAGLLDLHVLELLTARLCHELIGPIAAINNGVELLAEEVVRANGEADPDFLHDAIVLVRDTATRAASRLEFYRFAYGYGHSGSMAGRPPNELASRFFENTQIVCDYGESIRVLPLDWQRLACNLLLIGAEALSRGGSLVLAGAPEGLNLEANGEFAALSAETSAALRLTTPVPELTSRSVQAYFTGFLAETLGCQLVRTEELQRLRLIAVAPAG